jgi:hypothetical protein
MVASPGCLFLRFMEMYKNTNETEIYFRIVPITYFQIFSYDYLLEY